MASGVSARSAGDLPGWHRDPHLRSRHQPADLHRAPALPQVLLRLAGGEERCQQQQDPRLSLHPPVSGQEARVLGKDLSGGPGAGEHGHGASPLTPSPQLLAPRPLDEALPRGQLAALSSQALTPLQVITSASTWPPVSSCSSLLAVTTPCQVCEAAPLVLHCLQEATEMVAPGNRWSHSY